MQRDLAALADEVQARTGATLIVQNLVASTISDRITNSRGLVTLSMNPLPCWAMKPT